MQTIKVKQGEDVRIVGFGATIDKATAAEQIGALWQRVAMAGKLREGEPSYAAYLDYEDRLANRYRVVVGAASDAPVQEGEEEVILPAGDYAVFSAKGPAAVVAKEAWQQVWTKSAEPRRFEVDFERYRGTPEASELELFVGVDG
ncbi:MAG: GyrI-like domain-containing protein [Myxococcales bacterium]|nr:GyrI-like domain-containing protein [Myxococcales bacterium]